MSHPEMGDDMTPHRFSMDSYWYHDMPNLWEGETLWPYCDPSNEHDRYAVELHTIGMPDETEFAGFVPRDISYDVTKLLQDDSLKVEFIVEAPAILDKHAAPIVRIDVEQKKTPAELEAERREREERKARGSVWFAVGAVIVAIWLLITLATCGA